MILREGKRKWIGALTAAAVALSPLSSFADVALGGSNWLDSLKFGGDLRLRHDTLFQPGGTTDRNRERLRVRFGVEATVQDWIAVFRMASGNGSQLSANQTENGFEQKSLWIDLAYLQWKAHEDIKLLGGRMVNPFFQVYASDMMWDPDVNPEGYAEKAEFPAGERLKLFANFAQMPMGDFTSGSGADKNPWIFGHQLGAKATLFDETKLTMAVADYAFLNEKVNPIISSPGSANMGNDISAAAAGNPVGTLQTAFNILEFTNELAFHAGSVPLSLQGEFVTNTQEQLGHGRNGYQTGVIAGKAASAGTWEGAYFFKYLQQNATVASLADDDFGNGGTNRKGHIFWIAYSPRDYLQLKLKYYVTQVLDKTQRSGGAAFTGFNGDANRLFLDVLFKF